MNERAVFPFTPWLSDPYPCPYLPQQTARSALLPGQPGIDEGTAERLLALGFRRSGDLFYTPRCPNCQACVPVRVPAEAFSPDRTQRRTWQRLQPRLVAQVRPLTFDPEHYALYRAYVTGRHGLHTEDASETAYRAFLLDSPIDSRLVEWRERDGRLRIVAVIDVLPNALSAVYTWYDLTEPQLSLGTYAILWQIEQARRSGLKHVYLGYWIASCRQMAYKSRFRPLEGWHEGRWQQLETAPAFCCPA